MRETGEESSSTSESTRRVDADSGLPLPDPYPEYIPCPYCGEPEVEIWCYQAWAECHNCGGWIKHAAEIECRNGVSCPPKQAGGASASNG